VLLKYTPLSFSCFDKEECAVQVYNLGRADAKVDFGMKRQNSFDLSNPAGSYRIEIGAGLQSLVLVKERNLGRSRMNWLHPVAVMRFSFSVRKDIAVLSIRFTADFKI
ncbi:hypothetical protein AVEN_38830-1, partial [Araneus ventricosus]